MTNPTSNYGWQMPTATDLVTDLPADFEVFGQAVDTSLVDLLGGTTGQVLKKNTNADMDFVWAADSAGMTNPMTTTGDIIYSSPGSTPVRLGIGTANQILAVNSGATAPEWQTPAAAGGMTLISTTSLSGTSTVLSSIPQTYKHLFLTFTNVTGSNSDSMQFRFNGNTSTNYSVIDFGEGSGGSFVTGGAVNLNRIEISDFISTNAFTGTANFYITNYTSTSATLKSFSGWYVNRLNAGTNNHRIANGRYQQTSAISSITIQSNGTVTFTGTVQLYGVN